MNHELGTKVHLKSFTGLHAWQEGHKLVLKIYNITKSFPSSEQFGLSLQLRKASVSITSNVAEGFSRNSYKDKMHFYVMALGSLTETQNQLLIARDVGYLTGEEFDTTASQTIMISKLLNGLIKKTRSLIHNS